MTLAILLVFAGIMSFIAARSSYWVLKFLAGLAWWGVAAFWISTPPASITPGTPVDVIMIVLWFAAGLAFMVMTFWYTKTEEGQEIGRGFRLPFQKPPEPAAPVQTRNDRTTAYRNRVAKSLRGNR